MRPGASPGVPVMATQAELDALGTEADIPPDLASAAEPVPTAVSFGEGRRPESRTQVQMAEFDGPLALLLSLIEARQLDVLTVPLAALADAYLDALGRLTADRLGNVSSFVAIASQLILIKSRAMLPRPPVAPDSPFEDEGVDPEAELRARLLLYRAFRDAGAALQLGATERVGLFRREPSAALASGLAGAATAPATHPVDPVILVRALDGLVQVLPEPEPPSEIVPRTVTLAQRASINSLASEIATRVLPVPVACTMRALRCRAVKRSATRVIDSIW